MQVKYRLRQQHCKVNKIKLIDLKGNQLQQFIDKASYQLGNKSSPFVIRFEPTK